MIRYDNNNVNTDLWGISIPESVERSTFEHILFYHSSPSFSVSFLTHSLSRLEALALCNASTPLPLHPTSWNTGTEIQISYFQNRNLNCSRQWQNRKRILCGDRFFSMLKTKSRNQLSVQSVLGCEFWFFIVVFSSEDRIEESRIVVKILRINI